jgi:hypothetical protein
MDSRITVAKDRTVHVGERLEVANASGTFDSGIHRRLRIRPVGPERARAGSFQSIETTIHGRDTPFRTSADKDFLDIAIGVDAKTFSRGNHVVEIRYIAKNQFAIYEDSEEFNQDVSGEWPVSIEKATVELTFTDGFPKGAGISADSGTAESVPRFDCVRKNLPNGVRFETTHSVAPGERLFIATTFAPRGYFVSNSSEDGYRAIPENHPLPLPVLISLCGSIVLTGIGIVVWLRAPGGRSISSGLVIESDTLARFWREVLREYRFPIIMYTLAIVPGLNFTYSGHGGFAWFIAPLCFPWVIVRILIKIGRGPGTSSQWYKKFFKVTVPAYVAVSLPLSLLAVTSLRMAFGLEVSTWAFFALMVSPFPWWYFA